ncbi:MAG: ABC transporter permease [Candidatus Sacchiramonaceae bacterium]|nr:ABC transporter permease [Candidatus Saccharimonadaceae bacterium]
MLKIRDSVTLARTKFRTRRIRLTLSLVVISLLCSAVVLAFLVVDKSSQSLGQFANQGLNGRYLALVAGKNHSVFEAPTPELVARAEKLYAEKVAQEKEIAREIGYQYYEDSATKPIMEYADPGSKYWNFSSEIAAQVLKEHVKEKTPLLNGAELEALLKSKNTKAVYEVGQLNLSGDISPFLNNQKEVDEKSSKEDNEKAQSLASYFGNMIGYDEALTQYFISENYSLEKGEIPILINYKTAEEMLNLKKLEKSATEQEKYNRIQLLRKDAAAIRQVVCWRNSEANSLKMEARMASSNQNSPVEYDFSEDSCELPVVKSDTRTYQEKEAERIGIEYRKRIGEYSEPQSHRITFKVVGVMPDRPDSPYFEKMEDFLQAISLSTLDTGYAPVVPRDLYENNEISAEIREILETPVSAEYLSLMTTDRGFVAEFNSADEMRDFIAENSCEQDYCGKNSLMIEPFSNNAMIISDARNYAMQLITYAILAVVAITVLLIFSVVNRIMSDARKETAVFRAIGYSRFEVAQIYIVYVSIYAVISTVLTGVIVLVATAVIKSLYEAQAGLYFTNFFALKQPTEFVIVDFNPAVLLIFIPVLIVGLLASLIPLAINTRRSPLKNLRAE